jgi:hypothetical protein
MVNHFLRHFFVCPDRWLWYWNIYNGWMKTWYINFSQRYILTISLQVRLVEETRVQKRGWMDHDLHHEASLKNSRWNLRIIALTWIHLKHKCFSVEITCKLDSANIRAFNSKFFLREATHSVMNTYVFSHIKDLRYELRIFYRNVCSPGRQQVASLLHQQLHTHLLNVQTGCALLLETQRHTILHSIPLRLESLVTS